MIRQSALANSNHPGVLGLSRIAAQQIACASAFRGVSGMMFVARDKQLPHLAEDRDDVLRDKIENPRPMVAQSFHGSLLVTRHQGGEPDDIGGKDGGKASLHSVSPTTWKRSQGPIRFPRKSIV